MTITEFIDTGSGANDACLIYKLTNIKNNKVYIGQTKKFVEKTNNVTFNTVQNQY